MSEMSRDQLLQVVRETYAERDPVPGDLVARMQAVVALEADRGGGLDIELMLLVESERSGELAGARGGSAYTLRMVHGDVDLLLRIAPEADSTGVSDAATARVDGWIVPPQPMTVWALAGDLAPTASATSAVVSESGRFEFTDLAPGLLRLRFEPHDATRPAFATPTFEI